MPITHDYYGYKMTHDTGFAPAATNGWLSLACCMPHVRKRARIGAWIAGFGGARYGYGCLIYLMQVSKSLSFDEYFRDPKFSGRMDNIYFKRDGVYQQAPDARTHKSVTEMKHDTSVDRVLLADRFLYLGENKIQVRKYFPAFEPKSRMYCVVDGDEVRRFVAWVFDGKGSGIKGYPHEPLLPSGSVLIKLA